MGYPVHKFLEEFKGDDAQLTEIVRALRPRSQPAEPERAITARVEDAYSRGYSEGQEAARARSTVEFEALRADYEARMERTGTLFSDALVDRLVSELHRQIDAVHLSVSGQLAAALLPVMRHVLAEATVRELAGNLAGLLDETDTLTIELRGPQELIDRVTRRLDDMETPAIGREDPRLKCVVEETIELRVIINDTVIETRLMHWIERLAAAVK